MKSAARDAGRIAACAIIVAVLALVSACAGHPQPPGDTAPAATARQETRPATNAPGRTAAIVGDLGRYRVGARQLTFLEPPHTGPTGEYLGQRTLATVLWYPRVGHGADELTSAGLPQGRMGRPRQGSHWSRGMRHDRSVLPF